MRNLLSALVLLGIGGACASTASSYRPSAPWSMEADLAESCCCDAICPCIVGSSPTRGICQGNRLVVLRKAHYGDTNLDGVTLIVTFDIPDWTKLTFDDGATQEQVDATVELLKEQRSFLFGDLLEVRRAPLEIERTATTLTYASPNGRTEIEVMTGFEGNAIEVSNLRTFRDYVQYRSREVSHTSGSEEHDFTYSGTNGFTAHYSASAE